MKTLICTSYANTASMQTLLQFHFSGVGKASYQATGGSQVTKLTCTDGWQLAVSTRGSAMTWRFESTQPERAEQRPLSGAVEASTDALKPVRGQNGR